MNHTPGITKRRRGLSIACLRTLAAEMRAMKRRKVITEEPSIRNGWIVGYDVRIAGRRFSMWQKDGGRKSANTTYAITINGRIRYADHSPIFSSVDNAWAILTGITYLRRYENRSRVYGHELPVEIITDCAVPMLNYREGQIIRTEEHFDLPAVLEGPDYMSGLIPVGGDPKVIVGQSFYFVACDPCLPNLFGRGVLWGTVTGTRDGKAVIKHEFPGIPRSDFNAVTIERLRDPRHLYRAAA